MIQCLEAAALFKGPHTIFFLIQRSLLLITKPDRSLIFVAFSASSWFNMNVLGHCVAAKWDLSMQVSPCML